jgi:rhamnosyltransferase
VNNCSIAAVVVLYNTSLEVWENIKTYIAAVDKLYIIDNSEKNHSFFHKVHLDHKIEVLYAKGYNIGISEALNLALRKAKQSGYEWLMTMDQDSAFLDESIEILLHDFYKLDKQHTVVVSPLHNSKFIKINHETVFMEKEFVMTSANIVHVDKALHIGGYDENLFIDEVDHEFCFRIRRAGYSIFVHRTVAVKHALGTKNNNITLYTPDRLYYMIRNYLYIRKKYLYEYAEFFTQRDAYLKVFFMRQILYGKHRFKNLKMLLKGFIDYSKGQFGKMNNAS